MKLDKIRFARLISYLTEQFRGVRMTEVQIASIDEMIDVEIPDRPDVEQVYPSTSDINKLMELMAAGTQKIEAIKYHRKLTGWGLKESKEQVEKYWVSKPVLDSSGGYYPPKANGVPANQTFAD